MTGVSLLAVFLGGGSGAVTRYSLGRFIGERYSGGFPLATFLINVSGCFALGVVETVAQNGRSSLVSALLATGFLGGYTTFSTYTLEGVILYLDGARRTAVLSLIGPVVVGILAAALGLIVGQMAQGA